MESSPLPLNLTRVPFSLYEKKLGKTQTTTDGIQHGHNVAKTGTALLQEITGTPTPQTLLPPRNPLRCFYMLKLKDDPAGEPTARQIMYRIWHPKVSATEVPHAAREDDFRTNSQSQR